MHTMLLLLIEFETGEIPLTEIAQKYFGLDHRKAAEKARTQSLPIPVYRGGSQRSPWLVSAQDLAEYLDSKKSEARTEWKQVNN